MKKIFLHFILIAYLGCINSNAQSLLDSLNSIVDQPLNTNYTEATFKAPRVINGHSVELIGKNEMAAIISHRFGPISEGSYNMYGLMESNIRLGIDYGVSKKINLGFGIGSFQRNWDGFLKIKLLSQSSGTRVMPVTIVYTSSIFYTFEKWTDPTRDNLLSSRFNYSHQLHIARKLNSRLSLQITPGVVHRNLVINDEDQNNVFSTAIAGRLKLTNRLAVNAEYYYLLPGKTTDEFINSFSLSFDIETGGHIFQLLLTNSVSSQEKIFIAETTEKWTKGDVRFGFNIIRVFSLSRKKDI